MSPGTHSYDMTIHVLAVLITPTEKKPLSQHPKLAQTWLVLGFIGQHVQLALIFAYNFLNLFSKVTKYKRAFLYFINQYFYPCL